LNKNDNISFDHDKIEIIFPFYFVFDKSLKIISSGKSLSKIFPNVINSNFEESFLFKRPFSISYSITSISEYTNQIIILASKKNPEIILRGQILNLENEKLIFIGSPWLTSPEDLSKLNLNIPDFAIHDATTDMLQLLKNKEIMSIDILSLVESLKEQKSELKISEDELKYSNNRFSVLIQNMQSGILLESTERKVILTNKIFCEFFHIPAQPEQLIGYDCITAARDSKTLFTDSEHFIDRIDEILTEKKLVQNEELHMMDGTFLERDFVPIFSENQYHGHLWIYRNITERKKNEHELIYATEQAIISKKTKEQFLANMSHELRNPINIITGVTGLIFDTDLSEKQNEYLGIIKTASENLLALVNDILDFEKIQAKKIKFHNAPFDLRKCINEVYLSMKFIAANKNISLTVEIDDFQPTHYVSGDSLRLKQILFNLINNAIKFTERGAVKLSVTLEETSGKQKRIKFKVQDTGIGISNEDLKTIFDRYVQVISPSSNQPKGSGLGLTIVKNLVELQNGTIEVKSTINVGSTFSVTIPYQIIEHLNTKQKEKKIESFDLSGKNILIVEDDKINQMIITKMLEKHGATSETADNGKIALEKLNINRYHIILLDLQMPVMDGYTTAEQIRKSKNSNHSTIPIIAITANILSGEKEKCMEAGMNDYLSKPFMEIDLIKKVNELSNRSTYEETNLVDLTYLNSITTNNGNFQKKLIEEFLFQTPLIIEEIKNHLKAEDWNHLEKAAHKLKGSISFIGTPLFIKTASEIEIFCQKRLNLNLIPDMLNNLDINCKRVYKELERELKKIEL
jgi:signal transduction histidine kinase/CheY-like chemotaxis protein/HPt (histidine-containing phosphotransfer) domain-containing protein